MIKHLTIFSYLPSVPVIRPDSFYLRIVWFSLYTRFVEYLVLWSLSNLIYSAMGYLL